MTKKIRIIIPILFLLIITSCSDNGDSNNVDDNDDNGNQNDKTSVISQFGITWTFDKEYEYGQFANGDYWVVDDGNGVNIIEISPATSTYSGYDVNGSEKNPVAGTGEQGYDGQLGRYNQQINVARGISSSAPLTLNAKDCLISSISNTPPQTHDYGGQLTIMETCAILTCVDHLLPAGTFRPSYCDRIHELFYSVDDLNRDFLKDMLSSSELPQIKEIEDMFARLWLDNMRGWSAVYYHPLHMPNYGREIATELSLGALALHTDLTLEEKETLLVRYIQIGIDLYGVLVNGGHNNWAGDGGHGQGRKWPILFAGLMLDDENMNSIGQKSGDYLYSNGYGPGNPPPDYYHFGMDDQTFYVSQFDVDITNGGSWNPDDRSGTPYPYVAELKGMPEWAIYHHSYPQNSDSAWYAIYRQCCTAYAWTGQILACYIMGAKDLWNHNALFDYMDRYMAISKGESDPFGYSVQGEETGWRTTSAWIEKMWDEYRADYGYVWKSHNSSD